MIIYPFPTLTVGLATRRDEVIEDMILDVKDIVNLSPLLPIRTERKSAVAYTTVKPVNNDRLYNAIDCLFFI